MKNYYNLFVLSFLITLFSFSTYAAEPRNVNTKDLAVQAWATVVNNPPSITLHWNGTDLTKQFQISKKKAGALNWSNPIATLDSGVTEFTDTNVIYGESYEYEILALGIGKIKVQVSGKDTLVPLGFQGYGYLFCGIEAAAPPSQGSVILMIDQTMQDALSDEINTLEEDLVAEGWGVIRKYVPRSEKFDSANVINNKALIAEEYNKDPDNLKAVFVIGRVAVPYSGKFNQGGVWLDAHPDHKGAWPADLYYGFMNETYWTDYAVIDTTPSRKENWNKPNDGKFDLSMFSAGNVELMVGRVDFYNMTLFHNDTNPKFKKSETELLKAYFKKDHQYRAGITPVIYRGVVSDNFGMYTLEAFGASGWRSLMALLGPDSVKSGNFFQTLANDNYLWAYGCGGGYYNSCSGVGSTSDFVSKSANATFTLLFGSYFGDWDSQNNFLRASIASSPAALTCGWSGRPHWFMHHMGLGYPVGYSALATQNNYTTYKPNAYYLSQSPSVQAAGVNTTAINLIGDPTLKMYSGIVEAPTNLSVIQPPGESIVVSWTPANDLGVAGYNVYRSSSRNGVYTKINSELIAGTNKYIDTNLYEGSLYYMVRSVKIQKTNSGTFQNLSRGERKLILATSVEDNNDKAVEFSISPNPASDRADISLLIGAPVHVSVDVFDVKGTHVQSIFNGELGSGSQELVWNLRNYSGSRVSPGIYIMKLNIGSETLSKKLVVLP